MTLGRRLTGQQHQHQHIHGQQDLTQHFDTFPRRLAPTQQEEDEQGEKPHPPSLKLLQKPLSSFKPKNSPLPQRPDQHDTSGSSSVGQRSSGDGVSERDEDLLEAALDPYARVGQPGVILLRPDDDTSTEEEESHYSLIRQPDGRAEEQRVVTAGLDDAGYESLRHRTADHVGIDSSKSGRCKPRE